MIEAIVLLLTTIAMLVVKIWQLSQSLKISENNYESVLLALAEHDIKLKKYLEERK